MAIKGIEGLSDQQIQSELRQGAKFVIFEYTFSILVMTFKRGSAVHYLRPGESAFVKGLPYTLITLLFAWWGIPWGPIYGIAALITNLSGGKDVTAQIMDAVRSAH
jgi:hypothetical protein